MPGFHVLKLLFLSAFMSCQSFAQIYEGQTQQIAQVEQITQGIEPGSVLILGESHGQAVHRDQHLVLLQQLRNQGLKVSVGLEFLNYTDQASINQYRQNELNDDQFLSAVKWTGFSFDYYKQQLIFPNITSGEFSLGLNLPRQISSKISKQGLASLTDDERKLLPPQFALGRDSYKKRFAEAAGAHCPNLDNCFAAQSSWDDTMAWTASEFLKAHPEQVLVIVVGEFHAQFGGGVAYRILQRSPQMKIRVVSQIWAEGLSEDEIQNELKPSLTEGPRADFIWVSK